MIQQPIPLSPEDVRTLISCPLHYHFLQQKAALPPAGETVIKVDQYDGVKYHLADDSWLLIRPSGTEPLLRVYAEASSEAMVEAMLQQGRELSGQA